MRIAKLHIDPADKQRFEIHGKGSVKYHLKANHIVEAKRWYWTLNNAIQQAKDEARLDERKKQEDAEVMGRLREQAQTDEAADSEAASVFENRGRHSKAASVKLASHAGKRTSVMTTPSLYGDHYQSDASAAYAPKPYTLPTEGDLGDDEDDGIDDDDDSSRGPDEPPTTDSLLLTAHSARLQLDLLSQVALALQFAHADNPDLKLGDPSVVAALSSYETAATNLKQLINDLLSMSKERDSYWRYRMEKEVGLRRLWEENMMKLAEEQEALEGQVVGERERRKRTKRTLRKVLRRDSDKISRLEIGAAHTVDDGADILDTRLQQIELNQEGSTKSLKIDEDEISDSDESDQFFDAIDAGEVEVVKEMPTNVPVDVEEGEVQGSLLSLRSQRLVAIKTSFVGYDDPPRARLAMDADDRPKISLWVSTRPPLLATQLTCNRAF